MPMVYIADMQEVLQGRTTDVYFERTVNILKSKNINPLVKAEFFAKALPHGWKSAVFAGSGEAVEIMKTLKINVRSMREGSLFYPDEPVMEIEGRYLDFCVYETALLGFICQASGISTQAARMKELAGDRLVMSFGARRMHPMLAPMIELYAFMGGCDGVSVVKAAEMIGQDPLGTMPHALVLCMGSTVEAIKAYDEIIDPRCRRVALIDTLQDEKFEVLNVARAMGQKLHAVRFDTPSSRRGDFYRILDECRWELSLRGFGHIKFYVSGGISEQLITQLNPVVDGYGIGTSISNAPVIDFAMDIVEIENNAAAKRGKWSGSKSVLACDQCGARKTVPRTRAAGACDCGGTFRELLVSLLENGTLMREEQAPPKVREFVLSQIRNRPMERA